MIYVNIRGNFGNQLFEYAFARYLQYKYNQTICLNIYNLKQFKKEYTFNLKGYKLNDNIIVEEKKQIPFFANLQNNLILKVFRKMFPNLTFNFLKKFGIYIWLGKTYKEIPNKKHKNYYVDGYWQCDKYFNEIRDIILEEFVPLKNDNTINDEIYERIKSNNTFCVSIRRGDYITNEKYKKIFFVCNKMYFDKSIDYVEKNIKNCSFFVCSDDIEWAKENFKNLNNVFFESGENDVFEKIKMMSQCNNFILSNSSFSWWAQYLSKGKEKIVIAPSKWYANGEKTDIYEKYWKLIDA